MMRSHGIAPNAAATKPAPSRTPPTKTERRESGTAPPPASKKRKADQFVEDTTAEDDEEGFGTAKIKTDVDKKTVKKEGGGALSIGDAASLMNYYDAQTSYNGSTAGGDYGGVSQYDGSS